MKLLRDARILEQKSIASLRSAILNFNSFDDEGRVTTVLLHSQHSVEMLLKAVLCQNHENVFDKKTGRSIGFEKCLGICQTKFGLLDSEAGIFRAIDALRDEAQHWFVVVSEDLLYLQIRALITAFNNFQLRTLELSLMEQLPSRVLPISTKPPEDLDVIIDREYSYIADLLKPGKRQRDEARARIRSLLAMEAITEDGVEISKRDVDRIEKAIKANNDIIQVFPRLRNLGVTSTGDLPTLTVHFSKKAGPPVQFVQADDPDGAAAIREVDLQKKFYLTATDLAKSLNLTIPKSHALRKQLDIDSDRTCKHVFEFGKTKMFGFSDNAKLKMKEAMKNGIDLDAVWKANRS